MARSFGVDAELMNTEWAKAKGAKELSRFGGGFYCGLSDIAGKDRLYILNCSFMAMRSKFTVPVTEICYYSVNWDPDKLSWADCRGKVLGRADLAEAP